MKSSPETVPDSVQALSARFVTDIWPVLTRDRGGNSCVGCHNAENPSSLAFLADAATSFLMLVENGHFDPDEPAALMARVTASDLDVRMPPQPLQPLEPDEIKLLRAFVDEVIQARGQREQSLDSPEPFPRELLVPWEGPVPPPSPPVTFLTFWQLKGKILTIFGDTWHRNSRDLFAENVHLLGGADFVTRHSETTEPRADFLSALERLANDVASRAYLQSAGPFRDRPRQFAPPTDMAAPDDVYRTMINQLYRKILLRGPTEADVLSTFQLIVDVYRQQQELAAGSCPLTFEVEVKDAQTGLTATEGFSVELHAGGQGLFQTYVDQSLDSASAKVELKLPGTFYFEPGDERQMLHISNSNTAGNVSIAGLMLTGPLPEQTKRLCGVTDPNVEVAGTWSFAQDTELASYEDGDREKGQSSLVIPIHVEKAGPYEVEVLWRKNKEGNARSVLIEIVSRDRTELAAPPPGPPLPPPGEAFFTIDQTNDTVAFWDSNVSFRFTSDLDFVEINNAGTKAPVTADAVKFVAVDSGSSFLIDNSEAAGRDLWKTFTDNTAFNRIGTDSLTEGNEKKGELRLAYKPATKKEWDPGKFYRVLVSYPGKVGHEPRTPVVIRATASSPIVSPRYPRGASVSTHVELDASQSWNIQRSPLQFAWRQVGGPEVLIERASEPRATFTAPDPRASAVQAGWEALVKALLMHPDFLFTRAPALETAADPVDRQRLQLNKLALDLVGRPPTEEEISQLEGGQSWESFVDAYLHSRAFEEFYQHRIRLLLESHGGDVQDEPVRLWCHVAFQDRPFQEILTADYTVDPHMQPQPRPEHHGKTGILTTKGFIEGKPGLPHFNYAAQVSEKFLGYAFELTPEIEKQREGLTALSTTNPAATCYSCHKLLTPLAHQRLAWTDDGQFRATDEQQKPIDDSDRGLVPTYPFAGKGMEAFATKAIKTERFVRTTIDTHFRFFFGRQMRYRTDERRLYNELWDAVHRDGATIRGLIKAIVTSPEYLQGKRDAPS